jgi:hypothetical protein
VFLRLLNIIAGIEKIDYSNLYPDCIVYQLRFILFPYKKRFTLSYYCPKYQEDDNISIPGYGSYPPSTFPSVGICKTDNYRFFLYFGLIMDRGTQNKKRNKLWKLDVLEPLKLMQNMSDLWSGNEHKDEYRTNIYISGVWRCDRNGLVDLK